jgi:hypothetical protein
MLKGMATFAALCFALAATAPAARAQLPQSECKQGPLTKQFGKSKWLVYSCSDERTLLFVAPRGSAAFPFYFIYFPKDGGYSLTGEGIGSKTASEAAFKEIGAMSIREIQALIQQTRAKSSAQ